MTSFRSRLTIGVVALVVLTVLLLGTGSYLFVSRSLRSQFLDEALAQAQFDIVQLASRERLPAGSGLAEFEASGLAAAIRWRGGTELFVDFRDGGPAYASASAVRDVTALIDPYVRTSVEGGSLAWQWLELDGDPFLAVGGRQPGSGPDFYIFFPAGDITAALDRLVQAVFVGGAALGVVAMLGGRALAARALRPVADAAGAAIAVADGDLSARITIRGQDEFGALAESFNTMVSSLEQSIRDLAESRDRERRFVAEVSHELRTPLTALIAAASLLRDHRDALPSEQAHLVEMLAADLERLRRLVEDLLEISRLTAGSEPSLPGLFDAALLTRATADARCPSAAVHAPASLRVWGDQRRFERIVGNLLDNATLHAGARRVEVELHAADGELSLTVADRGPGVEADELDHLFDRFYKGRGSRTRAGSGLGLAIARSHARAAGGDLTAHLRPGGGLVFETRMPVAESLHDGEVPVTSASHTHGEESRPAPSHRQLDRSAP